MLGSCTLPLKDDFQSIDLDLIRMHPYEHLMHVTGHLSAVQLLEVLPNGTFAIGSDPRTGGHAAGY